MNLQDDEYCLWEDGARIPGWKRIYPGQCQLLFTIMNAPSTSMPTMELPMWHRGAGYSPCQCGNYVHDVYNVHAVSLGPGCLLVLHDVLLGVCSSHPRSA